VTHLRHHGLSLLLLAGSAASARPEDVAGRLVGFVEDARGTPVSGALISLFGNGLKGGGLVAVSDATGRFALPALPAGSYTLRALGGELRAKARQITVLPDQESIFSVSLFPPDESAEQDEAEARRSETPAQRELKWLLRHKRRSILEARDHAVGDAASARAADAMPVRDLSWLPLEGAFEVVTHSAAVSAGGADEARVPAGVGLVRLGGRLGDSMSWSLGGLLSESETSSWRMAAEFVVEPAAGHQVRTGAGYGSRWITPFARGIDEDAIESRSVGVLFGEERWEATSRLTLTAGARHSYIGFLQDRNHLDPSGAVEFLVNPRTRLRGAFTTRTLTPGGDLLTLSTLASAPAIAYAVMDEALKPGHLVRYEVSVNHVYGPVRMGALVFLENVRDPLVNEFAGSRTSVQIGNAPSWSARGVGFTLGRRFGAAVEGSLSYSYGRSLRQATPAGARSALGQLLAYPANDFHDFAGRLQAVLRSTDTRLVAFYRVNTLSPDAEGPGTDAETITRFDLQLSQGIPFLGDLTRADWELLLAYRNLFYETSEGGMLDELAVVNPPNRMLGGITVRF